MALAPTLNPDQLRQQQQAAAAKLPAVKPAAAPKPLAPAPAPPAVNTTSPAVNKAMRTQLMGILQQNPAAIDPNDPAMKVQTDAYNLSQQRSYDRQRADMAEAAAAEGMLDTGALQTQMRGLGEARGEAETMFHADLMSKELAARRQRLQEAMQLGAGILSDEQQRSMQKEIARIDASVRRLGIESQAKLGAGQLQLGLLDLLARRQISQDQLGWDMGKFAAQQSNPFSFLGGL